MYGTIYSAVAVPDDTDLAAESAMYAANGQYVFPVTEAQYPLVQAAVEDDSYFVEIEFMVLTAKPAKPGDGYVWDGEAQAWVVSTQDFDEARFQKRVELARAYAASKEVPLLFNANPYPPRDETVRDLRSVIESLEYFTAIPSGWAGVRSANGGRTTVSAAWSGERDYLRGMLAAMEDRRADLLSIYYSHLDAIDALTTISGINAYSVSTGWPTA